jgi:murein DD-endopeptidase MepM/ murein hydrolase activator NlpD
MNWKISTIVIVATFMFPFFSYAQTADDLQNKINQNSSQIEDIEAEIAKLNLELGATQGEKKSLQGAIAELNSRSSRLGKEIELTKEKISRADKTIDRLDEKYSDLNNREDLYLSTIAKNIRRINELDQVVFSEMVISSSVTDVANQISIFQSIQDSIRANVYQLRRTKDEVVVVREEQVVQKGELEDLSNEALSQKKVVLANKSEKNNLLSHTANKESNYQKLISEKEALREEFEASLDALESQLKFILDPDSIPKAGTRVFNWPLDYVLITQAFGRTADSARLYSYRKGAWNGRHTGVDFRANGNKVYSMATGKVIDFGNTDKDCPAASFGGWMLIEYNNGLSSIYSHLQTHVAKKGQVVKSGDLVAYSGNTGYSTGPHLDLKIVPSAAVTVETWPSKGCPGAYYRTPLVAGGTYLDPLNYLPKATDAMFK